MKVVILGAGGHGRVVADACMAAGWSVAGFLDDKLAGSEVCGVPVSGKLADFLAMKGKVEGFLVAIGDNDLRLKWHRRLLGEGCRVPCLVHPFSWVSPNVVIGSGTFIGGGVVINTGVELGESVIVNTAASVDHDCVIGDGCHISPGARIAGGVKIGEESWIGAGATVIGNISIGKRVVVGAGAVVIQAVNDGLTVAGVPAKKTTKAAPVNVALKGMRF